MHWKQDKLKECVDQEQEWLIENRRDLAVIKKCADEQDFTDPKAASYQFFLNCCVFTFVFVVFIILIKTSLFWLSDKCIYQLKMYDQGETWNDGCNYTCKCLDSMTGFYRCTERYEPNNFLLCPFMPAFTLRPIPWNWNAASCLNARGGGGGGWVGCIYAHLFICRKKTVAHKKSHPAQSKSNDINGSMYNNNYNSSGTTTTNNKSNKHLSIQAQCKKCEWTYRLL